MAFLQFIGELGIGFLALGIVFVILAAFWGFIEFVHYLTKGK